MKNILNSIVVRIARNVTLLFLFNCLFLNLTKAQIVGPSNSDIVFFKGISPTYLNNALADYYNAGSATYNSLMALTGGTSTLAAVKIYDGITSYTTTITPPAGYNVVKSSDIVIGGSNNTSNHSYSVGVIYEAHNNANTISDVYINIYSVSNPGNSMSVSLSCTKQLSNTNDVHCAETPHIYGISKYDQVTGVTSVDAFAATWQRNNPSTSNFDVMGIYSAFSTICSTTPTPVSIALYGNAPAVAAVSRLNLGFMYEDVALFTYLDISGNVIYQEWNMTTSTIGTAYTVGSTSTSGAPRIDATLDANAANTIYYDITYESGGDIYEANSVVNSTLCTSFFSGYISKNPVVAYGPGHNYMVVYHNNYSGNNNNYEQQISYPTGLPSAHIYQVNTITGGTVSAIARSCTSRPVSGVFVAWYNPLSTPPTVYYKIDTDTYAPGFKTAPTIVNNAIQNNEITISPNPSTGKITVNIPPSINTETYYITDVAGRQIESGKISNGTHDINLSNYYQGIYILNILEATGKRQSIKFAKQ